MPRPWMPHLSMCMLSSFDVTRGSKMRSCMAAGTPSPSSIMTRRRRCPSRDTARKMLLACASRALRSISMTISSVERMSCAACLRSASAAPQTDEAIPEVGLDPEMAVAAYVLYEGFQRFVGHAACALLRDADRAALADDHDLHLAGILHLVLDALRDVVREHVVAASSTVSGSTITRTSRPA